MSSTISTYICMGIPHVPVHSFFVFFFLDQTSGVVMPLPVTIVAPHMLAGPPCPRVVTHRTLLGGDPLSVTGRRPAARY